MTYYRGLLSKVVEDAEPSETAVTESPLPSKPSFVKATISFNLRGLAIPRGNGTASTSTNVQGNYDFNF